MATDRLRRGFRQRLWSTAKVAASGAKLAGRSLLSDRADPDGAIGQALFEELDRMKGVAMKVGQILSYFDGALPETTQVALRRLQLGAEPMSFETVRREIEAAFGAPPSELFDAFDERPIAAASIGQVHRARYLGQPVAVKVQYPGIRETMVADFSRLSGLSRLASLSTAVDGPALVRELAERMRSECDYLGEAENQRFFRDAFRGDAEVDIPETFAERTRTTVLTSAFRDGADFYEFAAGASPERRNRAGLCLARFAFHSLFQLGRLNADPHPGNYLFPGDERVVFLDFGCVTRFEEKFIEVERRLLQIVLDERRELFRDAVLATGMVPNPDRFDFDIHWDMLRHQLEPYRTPRFRFTFEYVRAGMAFKRPSNPNLRRLAIPPAWIWEQRLVWGLHAVLARLNAEGDFAGVFRSALC